ncbi:hypothetical protein TWF696_002075 [Orbilia brochopaga]|uniref:Uncharacterized protein n=1 Tax=Orbilia brochopaga TaxID=3140254 RepID=A0AAV9U6X2_9PEZI
MNVKAAIADMETGRTTSSFYQDGKGREKEELEVSPSAPSVWLERARRTLRPTKLVRPVSSFS